MSKCIFSPDGEHFARVITGKTLNNQWERFVQERCEHCGKVLDEYKEKLQRTGLRVGEWRRVK